MNQQESAPNPPADEFFGLGRPPALSAMILDVGRSDRMRSARPKSLQMLSGQPMVQYVIDALGALRVGRIVLVVAEHSDEVAKRLARDSADPRLVVIADRYGRGDGTAALAGLAPFSDDHDSDDEDDLLVLPGDLPLLPASTVEALVRRHREAGAAATVLTVPVTSLPAADRVITGRDDSLARVTAADAFEAASALWASPGVYCFRRSLFAPAVRRIPADSETGVFRVGDVLEVLTEAGHRVATFEHHAPGDLAVVDDRVSLAEAEAEIRRRTNTAWMQRGVAMVDPGRTYIDATVQLSIDVTLFPGTMLQGATVVGPGAEIGPDTRLIDCAVGRAAVVEKTVAREAEIGDGARVGPFAVLDPGTQIPAATVTGPFYHASSDDQTED